MSSASPSLRTPRARSLALLLALVVPALIAACTAGPPGPEAPEPERRAWPTSVRLDSDTGDTSDTGSCGHTQGWGC